MPRPRATRLFCRPSTGHHIERVWQRVRRVGDQDGAIYVADQQANQIRAFRADGTLLASFSGDGVLSAAEEPLVSNPRDVFVAVRDGQIEGLTFIADQGLIVCSPDLHCEASVLQRDATVPAQQLPSAQTVVPESWTVWQRGPSGPGWHLRFDTGWARDSLGGGLRAESDTQDAVQIAAVGSPIPTLLATLDGSGTVRQYDAGRLFRGLVGRVDPGYSVTALAVDAYATGRLLRQGADPAEHSHIIYYLGGQGRVDRVSVTRWWE